jgi:3'-5' exoribonuclease
MLLNNLQNIPSCQPGQISGDFRVRNVSLNETRAGRQYLKFFLEDMSGQIPAYIWREEIYRGLYLPDFSIARIEGKSRHHDEHLKVDIHSVMPVATKPPSESVRLIPLTICPIPGLLQNLQATVNLITLPALRQFVETVLADDSIAFGFVSAPASMNHHHNYPGGLLRHSLECVFMVERHKEFPVPDYQLGLVAALLHDIGKILTLTYEMKRTSLGASLDHDKLTLEVLAPYLKQLDQDWPEGGRKLRYLLTWKASSRIPKFNIADLVACCDRISTGLNMENRCA